MDLLYMFMGALCLAEGIALFTGKDFLPRHIVQPVLLI